MKTYLSIDLDYWAHREHIKHFYGCKSFFEKVFRLGVPISVVTEHHGLLNDPLLMSGTQRLINVDYHSDVVFDTPDPFILNDGTWVTAVPWRKEGHYIWVSPESDPNMRECGDCEQEHGYGTVFGRSPSPSGWLKASVVTRYRFPWNDIRAVGVCLSPAYCESLRSIEFPLRTLERWDWAVREMRRRRPYYGYWDRNPKRIKLVTIPGLSLQEDERLCP